MLTWGSREPTTVADGFFFLEGPRWHDGRVYVSDFYGHRVWAIADDGDTREICTVDRQPSGLGFTPGGDLLVVSMLDRRLLRLHGGALDEVADLSGHATGPCNDMVVDAAGRAYVGNFGEWRDDHFEPADLLLVDPDGGVRVAATGIGFANGPVLSADGRELVVSETFSHRVSRFDVAADGTLSGRAVWADFAAPGAVVSTSVTEPGAPVQPDGMTLDAAGACWVADARGSGILRVAPGGRVLDSVSTGDLAVFAAVLGGHDGRTLYLCVAPPLGVEEPSEHRHSALLRCRVDVPGAGRP